MKTQNISYLLNKKEIENLFKQSYIYNNNLIFAVENDSKTYDENKNFESIIEKVNSMESAFESGSVIIIKGLENYNYNIANKARAYGHGTTVHLYLNKNKGESFDYHCDPVDVFIHVLYGEKEIYLKTTKGIEKKLLKENDWLEIPQNTAHKVNNLTPCCSLSFGVNPLDNYVVASKVRL